MKKFIRKFIFSISILLFTVSCSSTKNERQTLRVGMELQFPPFEVGS